LIVLDTDPYVDTKNYMTLKQALAHATGKLKNQEIAKIVLKQAFESGGIAVQCRIILEEYALGEIRPFNKRRESLQISLDGREGGASRFVPLFLLKPLPPGAQVLGNWSKSDLAWIAPPPARLASRKSSFPLLVHLSKRTVMYDVRLKKAAVETVVSVAVRSLRGNQVSVNQVVRTYRLPNDYRELLPDLFAMADSGTLRQAYSLGRRNGVQARIVKAITAMRDDISVPTAKRVARMMLDREAEVKSSEQQLTNNDPNMN
jgi:hypothetical protein